MPEGKANKILIADDASFIRARLKDILTKASYEVVAEATNGIEAISMYQEHTPDLIILDIKMPEKTGLEALEEIITLNADAKIVMCSAMGQHATVQEAMSLGAKEFVVKPFQPQRLLEAIETCLGPMESEVAVESEPSEEAAES